MYRFTFEQARAGLVKVRSNRNVVRSMYTGKRSGHSSHSRVPVSRSARVFKKTFRNSSIHPMQYWTLPNSGTSEKILSPWVNTVGEIERHTWQDAAEQKSVS